jgi:hypothetical protein
MATACILAAVALALGLGVLGCGSDSDDGDGGSGATSATSPDTGTGGSGGAESFEGVLTGLRKAAESGESYDARDEAANLAASEKATIDSLCTILFGLTETEGKLSEEDFFLQVKAGAESSSGKIGSASIAAAAAELRDAYDLASINGEVASAYLEACLGGPPPEIG